MSDDERRAAIRSRLERVQQAHRDGEIDLWNREHHASWDDIEWLLAAVDQITHERDEMKALAYLTPERRGRTWKDAFTVAQHDAEQAEAALVVLTQRATVFQEALEAVLVDAHTLQDAMTIANNALAALAGPESRNGRTV